MYRNRRKLLFNLVFGPRQVKNLLAAYVAEVGTVLSPLHIHQLKYHKKGAPGRRRRKQCDVCRDGMSTRPVYNCKDCNFNLRATGLTQGGGRGEDQGSQGWPPRPRDSDPLPVCKYVQDAEEISSRSKVTFQWNAMTLDHQTEERARVRVNTEEFLCRHCSAPPVGASPSMRWQAARPTQRCLWHIRI